jgi:hypothetical protein
MVCYETQTFCLSGDVISDLDECCGLPSGNVHVHEHFYFCLTSLVPWVLILCLIRTYRMQELCIFGVNYMLVRCQCYFFYGL